MAKMLTLQAQGFSTVFSRLAIAESDETQDNVPRISQRPTETESPQTILHESPQTILHRESQKPGSCP